jgi:hypothetical protein
MTGLVLSDAVISTGLAIRHREARWLHQHYPDAELLLVGGSSVPGALTVGDIDLHCRVRGDFERALTLLHERYVVRHPELWQPTLATFLVPDSLRVELAATPAGSEHDDRFTRSWQRIRENADVLAEYNQLKRDFYGTSEYPQRKADFFTRLVTS